MGLGRQERAAQVAQDARAAVRGRPAQPERGPRLRQGQRRRAGAGAGPAGVEVQGGWIGRRAEQLEGKYQAGGQEGAEVGWVAEARRRGEEISRVGGDGTGLAKSVG